MVMQQISVRLELTLDNAISRDTMSPKANIVSLQFTFSNINTNPPWCQPYGYFILTELRHSCKLSLAMVAYTYWNSV